MTPHAELTNILGRPPETLRVWLVHDWLTGMRGGEKVLQQLARLFPKSKIATLFHVPGTVDADIEKRIHATSFLQRVPAIQHMYRRLLPVMPEAIKSISISNCDLVISTSHCVAKGISVPRGVPHLCYCFTPMRYVWETAAQYFADNPGFAKKMANVAAAPLRDSDLQLNEGVTRFATTCHNVAARIRRCYGREADVVYPGIDDYYIQQQPLPTHQAYDDFYLIVSALVPYKRVDLAVQAFAADRTRKLVIIGKGPDEAKLKKLAGAALDKTITFLGWQPDSEVRTRFSNCRALLFPGEEDFGLVPLEVQACGRPAIAYAAGGALETILPLGSTPHPTGAFFQQPTVESLAAAIQMFESHQHLFISDHLRSHAHRFTWHEFRKGICALTEQMIGRH
jgi:glycosyltransferase involved in cell wall biosynthesis